MLQLEYIDSKGRPGLVEAGSVRIRDAASGTLQAFAVAIAPGHNIVTHVLDKDFVQTLQNYGVFDTVIQTSISKDDIEPIRIH